MGFLDLGQEVTQLSLSLNFFIWQIKGDYNPYFKSYPTTTKNHENVLQLLKYSLMLLVATVVE